MRERLSWIDMLRGFSMLAILWWHTDVYYTELPLVAYEYYVGDVLAVFFFLSGYLFYSDKPLDVRHRLWSIFRWLVVPYFVFTSVIALPKALAHDAFEGFLPLVIVIVSGNASWFVAALIVAELLFVAVLRLSQRSLLAVCVMAIFSLTFAMTIGMTGFPYYNQLNLWHVNEAALGVFLMALGYVFHRWQEVAEKWLKSPVALLLLIAAFVGMKIEIWFSGAQLIFCPIVVSDRQLFIADLLVAVALLVALFLRLSQSPLFMRTRLSKAMTWVGRHSIVYYFICGGVPLVTARSLSVAGLPFVADSSAISFAALWQMPLAFILVCLFSTAIVWAVYRFTRIVK